ncbi:MAG TPA: type 4a pilus biogenesis protein PilO [Dissulfurispiraceae bacterium]|nr:type 4a pilus biogenesis protein PilO [Dissulfurispiraceae bacterium]
MAISMKLPEVDYEALSPAKQYFILFLPAVLIVAAALVLFLLPALDEREIVLKEIEQQTKQINESKQKAARLETLIVQNAQLKAKLQELYLQLPEEKEVSTLLRQVSEKAIESGLVISLWKPGARSVHSSQEVYEVPVEVNVNGSYHNFGKFFGEITRLNRIVNLDNINIKTAAQKQGAADLAVTLTAKTYSLIPEAERKAMQEAAKKK